MAHINRNYPTFLDLRLSSRDYYDLQIADYSRICNCDLFQEPIFCINFNNIDENCADDMWVDAVSVETVIPNFGITGYDTRYVNSLESDLELDGGKNFCLKAVNGDNFCYTILSGNPVQLCGGFFQGFYKLEGYDYQLLPDFFKDGWTAEFYLSKSGCTCDGDLPTLNETYPNNDGIFYYYGTRADNKFCSLKEHLLGYEVQSGLTFLEESIKDVSHLIPPNDENPFLFFNCPSLTDYFAHASGITFELPDCCDGLKYNALAFRITPEGTIGYRYLASSGTCIDRLFVEDFKVVEEYTNEIIFTNNDYHLVTIKFENADHHVCKPNKQTFGTLSIYVDGFLKLRKYDFPNIIPYAFEDLASKQLGVPYNISVGGGTQGLLEMQRDEPTEYNVCDYQFYIKKNQIFKGLRVNDIDYFSPDYTYLDKENILEFIELHIPNKFSVIVTKETSHYLEFTIKLVYDILNNIYYGIEIDNDSSGTCCDPNLPDYSQSTPHKTNCFRFITDNNTCGVLEENFAGTFLGFIKSFCLYDKPLTIEDIRCNLSNIYV